jgi:sugar O-acyltransferase (sialic acid O-acetyltransferase NeuD family)
MKPKLILIGGGGHCAACIDVIEQEARYDIAGIVDKDASVTNLMGYPILGNDLDLGSLRSSYSYALITLGQLKSPLVRMRLFEDAKSNGYLFPSIISPRAYVSKYASVGEGTIVMHDVLINARSRVGHNCIINSKSLVEHDAIVEDHCHLSTASVINGGVTIKRGTFVGSNAVTREAVSSHENDFISAGSLFMGHVND